MCRFRDPTGHKPNSISNGLPNPYPHGETASPANKKGTLRKLAKIANDVSVSMKLQMANQGYKGKCGHWQSGFLLKLTGLLTCL